MSRTAKPTANLLRLLADCPLPVYALDEERRIVYANAACQEWLGWSEVQLVGQGCVYGAPQADGPASAAASLCPPPAVFFGQPARAALTAIDAAGRPRLRRGTFLPLGDENGAVLAILESEDAADDRSAEASRSDDWHAAVRRFHQTQSSRFRIDRLIGATPSIVRARRQAALAVEGEANVVVSGPPGSGKELLARAIHSGRSPEGAGTLVPLDAAALDAELLAAAFESLARQRGSAALLLLHVDRLATDVQALVAQRIGRPEPKLQLLSTCDRPWPAVVDQRLLRDDLACALSTLVIELPSLAERLADLPLLAQQMVEECNARGGKQLAGLAAEALEVLAAHSWTGNLDELEAVIREAHEQASGPEITPRDLPKRLHLAAEASARPRRRDEPIQLAEFLLSVEKEIISRALQRCQGNKSKAARLLGLTRPRLYRRLLQLGLESEPPEEPIEFRE